MTRNLVFFIFPLRRYLNSNSNSNTANMACNEWCSGLTVVFDVFNFCGKRRIEVVNL